MSPPTQTRAKPLRTYSKRSAPTRDARGDAPAKKRRIADAESPPPHPEHDSPSESLPSKSQDGGTAAGTAPKPVSKGSIMSYFKPIPPKAPAVSSSPKSEDTRRVSTPPSSPPPAIRPHVKRKPRLLKFRGNSMPALDTDEEKEAEDQDSEEQVDTGKRKSDGKKDELERRRPPLETRKDSISNQLDRKDDYEPKKKKMKPAPTVQTTLNISSQAAFSECKVCDTVWNPLCPDDVKFHTKQHASVLRAKRKKEKENEL